MVSLQIVERLDHVFGSDVRQAERPDAGGVDHPPAAGEWQDHRLGGRVPSLADAGHHRRGPIGIGHKTIHQGRLADAAVADERGDLAREEFLRRLEGVVAAGEQYRQIQVGERGAE